MMARGVARSPLSLWAFPEAAVLNKTSPAAAAIQVPFGATSQWPYKWFWENWLQEHHTPRWRQPVQPTWQESTCGWWQRGGGDAAAPHMLSPPEQLCLAGFVTTQALSVLCISLHERRFPSVWTAHFGRAPPPFIMVAEAYLRCHFAQRWKSAIMFPSEQLLLQIMVKGDRILYHCHSFTKGLRFISPSWQQKWQKVDVWTF